MSGTDEGFERALGDASFPPEDDLGAFVRDVREAFPEAPTVAEEMHLAAIADAARRLRPEAGPVRGRMGGERRRMRFPRVRSRAAMVVAGLVVVMSSFGGLAFAGGLPGGVQDHVANAAATLGVNLPGGDDDALEVDDDANENEAPAASETESPEAEGQGEDGQADDRGENERESESDGHESKDNERDDRESGGSGGQQESDGSDEGGEHESDGSGGGGGGESDGGESVGGGDD